MQKKKKAKRRYTRLIDLILNIILLVICLFALYKCYVLQILPMSWLLLAALACLIIVFIFIAMMFLRMPSWGLIMKRIFLVALCVLIGFGGYSLGNVSNAINKVSVSETSTKIKVHLLASKTSGLTSVKDIQGYSIGVQIGTDQANTTYAQQELSKVLTNTPQYDEEVDYTNVGTKFMNGFVDCMIISDDYLDMLNTNLEGFKDSYVELTSFEHDRPSNPSDDKDITKESFTLLISGVDEVGAADQSHLSDVNILLFINPLSNQITMISLPRDSMMPHVALNNQNDKLTHTGSYGIDNTVQTVENFFDIDIDYYAKVSFTSLIEIVDAIDGVNVDVEISFTEQDENRSFDSDDLITLEAGPQKLNGKQALAYARHRKTDNYDVAGRERAQEKIIKAIIDKLVSVEGVTLYVNKLMEIVPKYVVTNMPGSQITSFIKGELQNIQPWEIKSLTFENGAYDKRNVASLVEPQSTYLWNKFDYMRLLDAYYASKENLQFNEFNFDFSNFQKYYPQIKDNPNIIWDSMAIDPY